MAVRAKGATDPVSRIERLISQQEVRIQAVFRQAIRAIESNMTLTELETALAEGRLEEALSIVEQAAILLGDVYGAALSEAARNTATWLSTSALTLVVSFDQTNERAVAIMRENRLRLVREFAAEQRATVRQALTRGIAEGLNPKDQARAFRQAIGLTRRQEEAVANFRRLLVRAHLGEAEALTRNLRDKRFDRTVRGAISNKQPLTEVQINRMVQRYRDRYVKYRSEVIARTEALRSVHQGVEEMYEQAIDAGALNSEELVRTWITARDERVRGSHRPLHGKKKLYGEAWSTGSGYTLRYPGDLNAPASETVQCRCTLTTRLEPKPE